MLSFSQTSVIFSMGAMGNGCMEGPIYVILIALWSELPKDVNGRLMSL